MTRYPPRHMAHLRRAITFVVYGYKHVAPSEQKIELLSTKHKAQKTKNLVRHGVTILFLFTTSKLDPLIVFNAFNSLSLQRISGAPLMYQSDPLSASINPYFLSALKMTWMLGLKLEISNDALSRTFIPIGGRLTLVLLLAQ